MKKFKTSKEWIEFWERFNSPFGTTGRMSDYWWNKLDKAWELWSEEKEPVYKKKNEDIYFLIEHQSTVDISMPYRIKNYVRT